MERRDSIGGTSKRRVLEQAAQLQAMICDAYKGPGVTYECLGVTYDGHGVTYEGPGVTDMR